MTSAVSVQKTTFIKGIKNEQPIQTLEDIPEWAIGNFTGVWGLNLNGQPQDPVGLVLGYYGEYIFGGLVTKIFSIFDSSADSSI